MNAEPGTHDRQQTTNLQRHRNGIHVIENRTFPNVPPEYIFRRSEMSPGAANAAPGRCSNSAHHEAVASGMTDGVSAGALSRSGVSFAVAEAKSQTTSVTDHGAELRHMPLSVDESKHDDAMDNVVDMTKSELDGSTETVPAADLYAHEIIEKARQFVAEAQSASSKETGGKPLRKSTIEAYAKYVSAYQNRGDPTEGIDEFVARRSANSNSFYVIRAALKHDSVVRMQTFLSEFEQAEVDAKASLVTKIFDAVTDYSALSNAKRKDALQDLGIKRRKARSKKEDLGKFPKSLTQQFLEINRSSERYLILGSIQCLTGCRPQELKNGVTIRALKRSVEFYFKGAKIGKNKGQEWRKFEIDRSFLPSWLCEAFEIASGKTFHLKSTDAIRSHYNRISSSLVDDSGKPTHPRLPLSPYVFRHLLVTELRESGWTDEEIAPVIGDQSGDTVRYHYGTFIPAKKRGTLRSKVIKSSVDASQIDKVRPPTKTTDTLHEFKNRIGKKIKPQG
jgi:hypothetical protein